MTIPAKPKVVGIDASKDSLAICHLATEKLQQLEKEYNLAGFKQLVQRCVIRSKLFRCSFSAKKSNVLG